MRLLRTSALSAIGVVLCCMALALHGQEDAPLVLGVTDPMALENACDCVQGYAQRNYSALAAYLAGRLGRPVKAVFSNTAEGIEKRAGRRPDLIVGKKSAIESEAKQRGIPIHLQAMLTDRDGLTTFQGLFIVRSGDPAKALSDLRGRTILFGPECCDEKHAAALDALRQANVPVPEKVETREACNVAAIEVIARKADAAVISSYALPLLEGCKTIAKGELKAIAKTKPVPFVAVYTTDGFPPARFPTLLQALLEVADGKELLTKLESRNGFVLPGTPDAGAP